MPNKKSVSIIGCGWFGLALATKLIGEGIKVKGSTTTAEKLPILAAANIEPYLLNFPTDNEASHPDFFDCDVLFIAIPPKVRSGNGDEYLEKIDKIIKAIKLNKITQVLFISSTGVYGDLNIEVDEHTEPKPDTASGKILLMAEMLFKNETSFTTTILRFAGLIGPGRDPGRFFAGKNNIPNGQAPVNLVHLTDCVNVGSKILSEEAFGHNFNICAPSHPSKAYFYKKAAGRSLLEIPEFTDELNNWKTVESKNVSQILNYQYLTNDLMKWLDN